MALGILVYLKWFYNAPPAGGPSTIKEKQVNEDSQQNTSTLPSKNQTQTNPEEHTTNQDTSTPPEKPFIERASKDSDAIKIVASFQHASSGLCHILLSGPSTKIERTAAVNIGSSYYTCSFVIPRSDMPDSGSLSLEVTHRIGNSVSLPSSQEIQ